VVDHVRSSLQLSKPVSCHVNEEVAVDSADDLRRTLERRRATTERAIEANRRDPRSGKNQPSRDADRGRQVAQPRGKTRPGGVR
jgi:hypothetical protein